MWEGEKVSASHQRSCTPTQRQDQCSIQSDLEEVTCLAGDTDMGASHPTAPAEEGGNYLGSQGHLHRRGELHRVGKDECDFRWSTQQGALERPEEGQSGGRRSRRGRVEGWAMHGGRRWGTAEGGHPRTD